MVFEIKQDMTRAIPFILCLFCFCVSLCANASVVAHQLEIRLNKGRKYTNQSEILVQLRHTHVHDKPHAEMRLGLKNSLSDAEWIQFEKQTTFSLPSKDGVYTIYAQTKDASGEMSSIAKAEIILDTEAPLQCQIVINDGAEFSRNKNGLVKIASSAFGARVVQFSNDENFEVASPWAAVSSDERWKINTLRDGVKFVYARFRDEAGNISEPVSSSITLDTTPPDGRVVINDGDKFTVSQLVYLSIETKDQDVDKIRVQGHRTRLLDFEPMPGQEVRKMLQPWWLDSINGTKVIQVVFKDRAGNVSVKPATDDIYLETNHPDQPFFIIDNKAKYCTDPNGVVTLKIGTRDNHRDYSMMVSNNEEFDGAKQVPFSPLITNWKLDTKEDGEKTVYLKVFNAAGSSSEVASEKIMLYRAKPQGKTITINSGADITSNVVVALDITYANAKEVQFSNNDNFSSAKGWISAEGSMPGWRMAGQQGINTVYARFRDDAGNVSEPIFAEINYDTQAPDGKMLVLGSDNLGDDNKEVILKLDFEPDTREMMISNDSYFTDADWEPVRPEVASWKVQYFPQQEYFYFKLKDKAGNESSTLRAPVTRNP